MLDWWSILVSAGLIAIPLVMLFIVPRNRDPSSAIGWLMLIALAPIIGLVLYWFLGTPRLPRGRRRKQAATDALLHDAVALSRAAGAVPKLAPEHASLGYLIEQLGGMPPAAGNHVDVLRHYDGAIKRIAKDIDAARHFVHLQYYILARDDTTEVVFTALEAAVERGVEVRVLFDHIGSRAYRGHRRMLRRMTAAGIQWQRLLPFQPLRGWYSRPDLRNHRKIMVIDGRIAYAGSQNMIARTYLQRKNIRKGLRYQEVVFRAEGPVAAALDAVYRADWFAETDETLQVAEVPAAMGNVVAQVLPSGPAHEYENNLILFNQLAYHARKKITLVNPYFVPAASFVDALTTAAQRGVEVTLITVAEGDHKILDHAQRSYYEALLRANVRIFLYPPPAILHSKTLTVDDDLTIIGSSNLDMRSFHLNLEVSTLFYDKGVNESVRGVESAYLSLSEEIHLEEWLERPIPGQIFDSIARLTAHLQ